MVPKRGAKKKSGCRHGEDAGNGHNDRPVSIRNLIKGAKTGSRTSRAPLYGDELYRTLAENSVDFIYVIDRGFRVKYVNRSGAKILGMSPEDATGRHLNELFQPDTADTMIRSLAQVFESGKPSLREMTHHFPLGDFYIHVSLNPIFDADGRVISVMGVSRDINELKRAEEALRESEERLRLCIATARLGSYDWDVANDRHVWSPETYDIYGIPQDTPIALDYIKGLIVPEDRRDDIIAAETDPAISHGEYGMEYRIVRPMDGAIRWINTRTRVFFHGEGAERKAIRVLGIVQDITERKRIEEALMEAKAQAELYVDLMGHDINNMNQVSMGFLELAHDVIETEGRLVQDNIHLLDKAMDSLKNSSQLIDSVRKIQGEKRGMYEPQVLDIGAVIEDAVKQFDEIPGRDVKISYDPYKHYLVNANSLLKDVFINLIGNAVKHSRGSLVIDIHVNHVTDHGKIYYRVNVEDNGPGIPDALKETLFDRLNLTTTRAKGKGFGLCLIKLLVDDYQGKFWVEDRIKGDYTRGARFVVLLPAVEK